MQVLVALEAFAGRANRMITGRWDNQGQLRC